MIVDLEEKPTESGTFDLKGGGKLSLRLLSASDIREMRKACFTVKAEYPLLLIDPNKPEKGVAYRRFEVEKFDSDLWEEMLWDRTITGFADVFDRNKKPIPVTAENKALLMRKAPEFAEAYTEGLKTLKAQDEERSKASEKN